MATTMLQKDQVATDEWRGDSQPEKILRGDDGKPLVLFRGSDNTNAPEGDVVHFALTREAAESYGRKHVDAWYAAADSVVDAREDLPGYLRTLAGEVEEFGLYPEHARQLLLQAAAIEAGKSPTWEVFQTEAWKMSAPSESAVIFSGDWAGGDDPWRAHDTVVFNYPEPRQFRRALRS